MSSKETQPHRRSDHDLEWHESNDGKIVVHPEDPLGMSARWISIDDEHAVEQELWA